MFFETHENDQNIILKGLSEISCKTRFFYYGYRYMHYTFLFKLYLNAISVIFKPVLGKYTFSFCLFIYLFIYQNGSNHCILIDFYLRGKMSFQSSLLRDRLVFKNYTNWFKKSSKLTSNVWQCDSVKTVCNDQVKSDQHASVLLLKINLEKKQAVGSNSLSMTIKMDMKQNTNYYYKTCIHHVSIILIISSEYIFNRKENDRHAEYNHNYWYNK
jgi:hypothetical protein